MVTLKKDGRVFTSSPKQVYLFGLLLDKINSRPVKCSVEVSKRLDELYESYKTGKLSIATIKRKASTFVKPMVTGDRREFVEYFDGTTKIIENDLHIPKCKGLKQYYLVLPEKAKNSIVQIFTSGIRSKAYGALYTTNPMAKCKNHCVVELLLRKIDLEKIERNLFEQSGVGNLEEGLYYKGEIIPIKNIVKIHYENI